MITVLVEPPEEYTREAHVRALAEAEALPADEPDRAEIVAARRRQLEIFDRSPFLTDAQRAALVPLARAHMALIAARRLPDDAPGRARTIAAATAEVERHRETPLVLTRDQRRKLRPRG